MMKFIYAILFLFFASCASSSGIFPAVSTSTSESDVIMPNPISIAIDTANSQILVANSNVDVFFESGSLALLSVDASTPSAPQLSISEIISAPNFATEIAFDGTSAFIPFRESSSTNSSVDIFNRYTISAGDIAASTSLTIAPDPFGIVANGTNLFVVSDDALEIYSYATTFLHTDRIDLTTAEDAELEDSDADHAEDVAIDTINNLAFVSNRGGSLFIVDLSTDAIRQIVSGPTSTRTLLINNRTLYALDGLTTSVWVFNLDELPDPSSTTPEIVDESDFVVTTVNVGNDPNGMALDAANNRLYVANSSDDSISVIDTSSLEEIARVGVGEDDLPATSFNRACDEPIGLALGTFNATQYLFVSCFKTNAILMLNTQGLGVAEVFPNTAI